MKKKYIQPKANAMVLCLPTILAGSTLTMDGFGGGSGNGNGAVVNGLDIEFDEMEEE